MTDPIEIRQNGVQPVDEKTVKKEKSYNIFDVHDVDIRNGKTDIILQLICACLNSKQRSLHEFELQFNIVKYSERITSKEFDDFYKKIETKLLETFRKNFCDFIERKGDCDSNRLIIIVKKSPELYSLKNYLYIPTASSVYESQYEKTVCILKQTGDSEKLPKPVEKGSYKICEIVTNLRQENVDVQFKTLNTEKNIAKNMADHFKYISAFANKDGGCLYFGIEDKDGRVVGVNSEQRDTIDKVLTNRINSMILASGYEEGRKLERGVHWNIEYFHIEADNTLGDLFVSKCNSIHLNCKSKELLERISNDGRDLGTFKQRKKRRDDEHEEENIGFVWMSSVIKSDGEWYIYTSGKHATNKNKFDMSYGKDDVLEFVKRDSSDNKWWKMKKLINKKEFSMPRSHLKKLHIGKGLQGTIQDMETEERNIIVITVAKIPGGVLTACPVSYYADEEGCVQKYTFPQWKVDMVKSRPGPCNIEKWDLERNLVNTANDRVLKECMMKSKCVILKGLIGTGKTSLALKYCLNFKEENPLGVVWKFKCSSIELLQTSMHELWNQIATHCNKNMNQVHPTDIEKLERIIIKELTCRENISYSHIFLFDGVTSISKEYVVRFSSKCMHVSNMTIIMTTPLWIDITDSKVVHVEGFLFNEAANLFQINPKNAGVACETLAKMLWYNPFAMCIAKAYMRRSHMTFDRMVKVLKDHGCHAMENSKITKDEFNDQPLTSFVLMIGELEESYNKNKNTHIFEMLLMLQFLESEDIPVILFYTMFDTLKVNDFLYEVEYFSLGFRKKSEDYTMLTVHEMAVTALNQFTKDHTSASTCSLKIKLLKQLLRSLFLSMDKDNNTDNDVRRLNALLPHAHKVIDCVEKLTEYGNIAIAGKEFQMHFIFVADIITYTMGLKITKVSNRRRAIKQVFNLLNIDDPFVRNDTNYKTEDNYGIQQVANIILTSIECFLKQKSNITAVEKVAIDYLLNKYRNIKDRENLCKVLSKQQLEKESHLVEAEYNLLCQKDLAVPRKDIGLLFLYELVILVLHSYGKRSLQEPLGDSSPNTSKSYLQVAYILSNRITPGHMEIVESNNDKTHMRPKPFQFIVDWLLYFWTRIYYVWRRNQEDRNFNLNSLSTILIERSLLQLQIIDITDDKVVSTIIKYLDICKERLNETTHYREFGVFKVDTKACQLSKLKWMEQIIGLCNELVKVDAVSSRKRVKEECESLRMKIGIMQDNKYKWELQLSLGKLCCELEEFEIAEDLFKPLLPNITGIQANATTPNYTDLEQQSSLYYIKCRIEREDVNNEFDTETKEMLQIFLICFQSNDKITKELHRLSQKLEETRRDNFS